MMPKKYLLFFTSIVLMLEPLHAKNIVDCRVLVSNASACNPYGEKLMRAKEIGRTENTRKLIIIKRLRVPQKPTVKVISVEEMIEKHYDVEDSLRFKGSGQQLPNRGLVKKLASEKALDVKIETLQGEIEAPEEKIEEFESKSEHNSYGAYRVEKGDVLSKIAKKFGLKTEELIVLNGLKSKSVITVDQELKVPLDQTMIDALVSAEYKIQEGDTLLSIAKKFSIEPKALANFNNVKNYTTMSVGKILKLPLPYVVEEKKKAEEEKKKAEETKKNLVQQKKSGKLDMLHGFGTHSLRVTATAYTSHADQTNSSPFVAAWGTRLRSGMKIIAVSRDMLTKYGMRNGTKVRVSGLPGYYTVRDKMNKRYRKRIDLYMGMDKRSALRWGRRSVVIYW